MSVVESIYYRLPPFLQNIAVSLKGYQLKKVRKGGEYQNFYRQFIARTKWTREQHDEYQVAQLKQLIGHAVDTVPFYRNLAIDSGLSQSSIGEINDIKKLPLLSRDNIKENPDIYVSETHDTRKGVVLNTTGTTGSPLRIIADKRSRKMNYALYDSYLASIGVNSDWRHAVIGGRVVMSSDIKKPPFWRYSVFQRSLLMSSYHLSDDNLDAYVEQLRMYAPVYIDAYPSSVYRIAQYILEKNLKPLNVKAVITSAETLFSNQRETIEIAFNTKVYDQYGCAEMCVFAAQCEKGVYHVRPDFSLVEILDDNGASVPEGMVGNIVCTAFSNYAMPLIRYPIGDRAAFGPDCDCGLNTPVLKSIEGRKDDVIYTKDNRAIGRLSPVLKGHPVKEAQYIQSEIGKLRIKLVPAAGFKGEQSVQKIEQALRKRTGSQIDFDFEVVDSIERGKGGKLRAVVSYVE